MERRDHLYLAVIWIDDDPRRRRRRRGFAERQDENAYIVLTAVSLAAVMSLAAIVLELATAKGGAAPTIRSTSR